MTVVALTVTILGSGTSTGVPVAGCACPVCTSPAAENHRTRCSALLSWGGRNVLIDPSTDLRQQALREKISRIDAVLLTHTHADHVHGIDDLRPFNPASGEAIPVFGSPAAIASLRRNFAYIFAPQAEGYRPRLATTAVEEDFQLFGLTIRPVPLRHGAGWSLGYRIGPFAYLADCNGIPAESARRLQGLEAAVIDALRFRPHTTHFNIPGAIAAAAELGVRRVLLTHLSHDVDHHRDGAALPSGVELARDGQRLDLLFESRGA